MLGFDVHRIEIQGAEIQGKLKCSTKDNITSDLCNIIYSTTFQRCLAEQHTGNIHQQQYKRERLGDI